MTKGKPIKDYTILDLIDEFVFIEVVWYWNDLIADPTETDFDFRETMPPEIFATGRGFGSALEKGLLKSKSYAKYKRTRNSGRQIMPPEFGEILSNVVDGVKRPPVLMTLNLSRP